MKHSDTTNKCADNSTLSDNGLNIRAIGRRSGLLINSILVGIFFVSAVPTVAHASATNCDYRPNFIAFATGAANAYAQCMTVKGRGLNVREIKSYFIQYVTANLGPAIPTPIPNIKKICNTTIQWRYKRKGSNTYTHNTRSYGCSRPPLAHNVNRNWKPKRLKLKDKSNACMRWKSDRTGKKYTKWTCVKIKK